MTTQNRPIAIVTGASRRQGIGAAVCRALASEKVDIFFSYWEPYDQALYGTDREEYKELLATIRNMGVRCECIEADLSIPETIQLLMDETEIRLGSPSILVNNAVHDDISVPFEQVDAAILDKYYAVNIRGTLLLSIEFARRFSRTTGGRIISLSSGQSMGAMPEKLAYATTKGAIEAFTITLAAEVASRGITVNAIDPGPTDTGWLSADSALKEAFLENAPFGRLGQPEDAAHLIAFLASDAGEWITGQVIHSRGGL